MNSVLYQWCSWCHEKTCHHLVKRGRLTRNKYRCASCHNYTVQCRYCGNMAAYKPADSQATGLWSSLRENWASELCAEHDGTIADFEKLHIQLEDLADYESIFRRKKFNLLKGSRIAGGVIAGAAIFSPIAFLAAPGVASALGAAGLLGTASTGTAISALSGAALTSASLVALGPGGAAGGVAFVSAVGAALGGVQGAVVSNSYFGAVRDFRITKVKEGTGPGLVFINGFLSQKNQDPGDWMRAVAKKYPDNPCYYVNWESSSQYKMGRLISRGAGAVAFKRFFSELVRRGGNSFIQKLNPFAMVQSLPDIIGNPWHTSLVKASMTGILLADLIARTKTEDGFILMGHSLGSRVIFYILCALATKDKRKIRDAYLLGGAVDRRDNKGWSDAVKAVKGKIYNCHSDNDSVLRYLYHGANALLSRPVGLDDITLQDEKIVNMDVTSIIEHHMQYKDRFDQILEAIDSARENEG